MSRFFIPSLPGGDRAAELAYRELRDQAEACTGAISRERRIERVLCRLSGRDCVLLVGEPDPGNGRMVSAIIQLGRDTYAIHHLDADPGLPGDPLILHQSNVYSVTDFQ